VLPSKSTADLVVPPAPLPHRSILSIDLTRGDQPLWGPLSLQLVPSTKAVSDHGSLSFTSSSVRTGGGGTGQGQPIVAARSIRNKPSTRYLASFQYTDHRPSAASVNSSTSVAKRDLDACSSSTIVPAEPGQAEMSA